MIRWKFPKNFVKAIGDKSQYLDITSYWIFNDRDDENKYYWDRYLETREGE